MWGPVAELSEADVWGWGRHYVGSHWALRFVNEGLHWETAGKLSPRMIVTVVSTSFI